MQQYEFIPSASVPTHRAPSLFILRLSSIRSPPMYLQSCINLRSINSQYSLSELLESGELTELWRVSGDWSRGRADS